MDMIMLMMMLTIMIMRRMVRMFFELSYLAKDVRRGAGTKGGDGESAHTDKTRHAISGAQSIVITNALIINSVIIY